MSILIVSNRFRSRDDRRGQAVLSSTFPALPFGSRTASAEKNASCCESGTRLRTTGSRKSAPSGRRRPRRRENGHHRAGYAGTPQHLRCRPVALAPPPAKLGTGTRGTPEENLATRYWSPPIRPDGTPQQGEP